MRKYSRHLIILLLVLNIGVAFYCRQQIIVDDLDDMICQLVDENKDGVISISSAFNREYLIQKVNFDQQEAYKQLIESSDVIITGTLNKRKQDTNLIISEVNINKVYKGNLTIDKLNITEFYGISAYEFENATIDTLNPLYGPILEDREYVFFLKEIYPDMYSYTDLLYTKFPTQQNVKVGHYQYTKNHYQRFDSQTFYSSDILQPLDYKEFIVEDEVADVDYVELYNGFNKVLHEKGKGTND